MPAPALAILASAALPSAIDALSTVFGRSANPAIAAAGQAMAGLGDAIAHGQVPQEELEQVEADLNKLFELENARLAEVNQTMRAEANSEDPWVRRWRPMFGYSIAFAWTVQMLAVSAAILLAPHTAPALLMALGEGTALQWSIALAVLGVGIYSRSRDKGSFAQSGLLTGVAGRAIDALRGGSSQGR
jgi:hypothetical protein